MIANIAMMIAAIFNLVALISTSHPCRVRRIACCTADPYALAVVRAEQVEINAARATRSRRGLECEPLIVRRKGGIAPRPWLIDEVPPASIDRVDDANLISHSSSFVAHSHHVSIRRIGWLKEIDGVVVYEHTRRASGDSHLQQRGSRRRHFLRNQRVDHVLTVRPPGRLLVSVHADSNAGVREVYLIGAIGVHDPDITVTGISAAAECDPLSIRRPRGLVVQGGAEGQLTQAASIPVDDEDVSASVLTDACERDLLPIPRHRWLAGDESIRQQLTPIEVCPRRDDEQLTNAILGRIENQIRVGWRYDVYDVSIHQRADPRAHDGVTGSKHVRVAIR